jgi:outer membrane lipoprotein-sorting protein
VKRAFASRRRAGSRSAAGRTSTVDRHEQSNGVRRAGLTSKSARATLLAMAVMTGLAAPAAAQTGAGAIVRPAQSPPATWGAGTQMTPAVTAQTFDERQIAAIGKVNAYFNALDTLSGQFVQTAADNKRDRGRFYVKRPGRFRFEYSAPSRLLVVSDGKNMSIVDPDVSDHQRIALDDTVFRILLRQDVDLLRDSQVLEVSESEDLIVVALQDKGSDAVGRIRIFMAKGTGLELKEWVTTDAHGLDTRIRLNNVTKGEALDDALFKPPAVVYRSPQGG